MKSVAKRILSAVALLMVLVVAGCNTVHGVGEDTEKAGEGIQKAADKNR
jgi:predicted small secreted protein